MPKKKYKPGQLYTERKGSSLHTFKVGANGKPTKISETRVAKKQARRRG